ncbi:hypothetical protein ACFOJ6_06585 [Gordonia humi]|uniref:hypothetical protein n=1 Tax=Gordonia humi TaxID=686429 RepID=UPI00360E86C5
MPTTAAATAPAVPEAGTSLRANVPNPTPAPNTAAAVSPATSQPPSTIRDTSPRTASCGTARGADPSIPNAAGDKENRGTATASR